MIAELFYPKELKDAIADLRAKNDLNEEAELAINKMFFLQICAALCACAVFYSAGYIFLAVMAFVALPLYAQADFKKIYNQRMKPYLEGMREEILVIRKDSYRFGDKLICRDAHGYDISTPLLAELQKYRQPPEGERIWAWVVSEGYNKICMPNIQKLTRKYCLSKSMIEEASKNSETPL